MALKAATSSPDSTTSEDWHAEGQRRVLLVLLCGFQSKTWRRLHEQIDR
jgi:hypothetical protein